MEIRLLLNAMIRVVARPRTGPEPNHGSHISLCDGAVEPCCQDARSIQSVLAPRGTAIAQIDAKYRSDLPGFSLLGEGCGQSGQDTIRGKSVIVPQQHPSALDATRMTEGDDAHPH